MEHLKRATAEQKIGRGIALALAGAALIGVGTKSHAQANPSTDQVITSLSQFESVLGADASIIRTPVTFKNGSLKLAGLIFTPSNLDQNKKHPTIVVVHPGGGIKEQTASLYAYRLAQQGYVAFTFDASHQGESEGEPRGLENPTARVEDARSAVDFVTTLPYVDRNRIAALGICAGGGYAIATTATDHRIKAVAGVSAVDFGMSVRNGWRNTASVKDQTKTLLAVAQQRTAEANGAKPLLIPYVPDSTTGVTEPDMVEASDYYVQPARWQHPRGTNRFLNSSLDKLTAFSAFDRVGTLLTQPLLLIVGSNAGSKWQSEKVYRLAKSPKELFVVKGGTHMSLYDRDVVKAMPKLISFYEKYLK